MICNDCQLCVTVEVIARAGKAAPVPQPDEGHNIPACKLSGTFSLHRRGIGELVNPSALTFAASVSLAADNAEVASSERH